MYLSKQRAKLKTSISRLVNILFPELEKLVPTLHMVSVYKLLNEYPGASIVADVHLTKYCKNEHYKDAFIWFKLSAEYYKNS